MAKIRPPRCTLSSVADVEDIKSRLQDIAEDLAELALASLRDAVDAGAAERPEAERRYTRARTSVEKAIHLLEGVD